MKSNYQLATKAQWSGRKTNPELGNQYWYQAIEFGNATTIESISQSIVGLIGYACDEGVRRNQGRVGAVEGPNHLRGKLGKIPVHFNSKRIIDFGDVHCSDAAMELCQKTFSETISNLIKNNVFPIAFGGGHDIAYAHFMGIQDALKDKNQRKIGIINFDAHFDLRPVETQPNSGTPFNQIINELKLQQETVDYFVIGIQQQSNTKELFDIAEAENVQFVYDYECENTESHIEGLQHKLKSFINNNDHIYITIDLDGFSSAYVSGVSAPSPLGFSPYFVFKLLRFLLNTNKVISCDIAELNPMYDIDGQTASLAAKLVDFIVVNKP